jgi:ABC-type phosphate transport system permease subunit
VAALVVMILPLVAVPVKRMLRAVPAEEVS